MRLDLRMPLHRCITSNSNFEFNQGTQVKMTSSNEKHACGCIEHLANVHELSVKAYPNT